MPETCRVIYDNKSNCCIKLVPLVIFIYDTRTHIHQTSMYIFVNTGSRQGKDNL